MRARVPFLFLFCEGRERQGSPPPTVVIVGGGWTAGLLEAVHEKETTFLPTDLYYSVGREFPSPSPLI